MSSTTNQDATLSGKVSTQEMLLSGKVSTLETLIGPPGPKGDPGDSYTVKGPYTTLSALQSAHPTGSAGDAWFVGTSENNVVYQRDVNQSAWVNVGALKGPKGAMRLVRAARRQAASSALQTTGTALSTLMDTVVTPMSAVQTASRMSNPSITTKEARICKLPRVSI